MFLFFFCENRLREPQDDEKTGLLVDHDRNFRNYGVAGDSNSALLGNFADSAYLNGPQPPCFVYRKRLFVAAIVVFVVYLIVALSCGWDLDHC